MQKKKLTSINFNQDLFLFLNVNKTLEKCPLCIRIHVHLVYFLKITKIWCAFKTDMSLCQITGSYWPYHCKVRAKNKFQKYCTLTNPPKDIYEPMPIGTFPFMSGSPFSCSDDDTLCLRVSLSSSVLLIFTSWVWRLINFASSVLSLTISR